MQNANFYQEYFDFSFLISIFASLFRANHNKDYSVVKTLGSPIVLNGGLFVSIHKNMINFLTSSLRTPKIFVKEFCYFLMPCHQHGLGVNLIVQR